MNCLIIRIVYLADVLNDICQILITNSNMGKYLSQHISLLMDSTDFICTTEQLTVKYVRRSFIFPSILRSLTKCVMCCLKMLRAWNLNLNNYYVYFRCTYNMTTGTYQRRCKIVSRFLRVISSKVKEFYYWIRLPPL
jgi:hypothetical protein